MENRVYLVVRKDLNMRRGKEIAQACHAVVGLGCEDMAMITLQVGSEENLLEIFEDAKSNSVPVHLVRDLGRTEVAPNTPTCLALGPVTKNALVSLVDVPLY